MLNKCFIRVICLFAFYAMMCMFFETENIHHPSIIKIQASTKQLSKKELRKKYEIDGKSVSEERYKKALKAALKGYKKVTPMDEFRY
ncbi:MAG: hypothetical protein HFG32_04980 [Eubacterium sp.]|nr:hypothetical protein [Eubacterium sp.]